MTALRTEKVFGMSIPVYPPEDEDSRVAAVVARFDADRVHAVMSLLGWRWGGADTDPKGVPSADQIRQKAAYLLWRTLRDFASGKIKVGGGWGTGGLRTSISERGELHLWFELCGTYEQIAYETADEKPLPAGYLCVGDPRTWSKS